MRYPERYLRTLLIASVFGWCVQNVHAQERTFETPINLMATTGQNLAIDVAEEAELTVLFFTGVECPLAKLYAPRIAKLANDYLPKSVRFVGINSNQQDSVDEFAAFVAVHKIDFPCGKDYDNVVADQFQVKRTPEVIVLDQEFNLLYRGRIDDQYSPGVARIKPNRNDLKIALDELLSGNDVSIPETEPEGCLLGRIKTPVAGANVTYAKQVSRIFQQNCVECHRAGEIGPFVMDDYDEVVGWADMIVETIDNGRMPPWHADKKHGSFLNARLLSNDDKNTIRQWVDAGAPFGSADDLPPPRTNVSGWRLPKQPDFVINMADRPFTIPSAGTVEYQYFVVDPKFTQDKWVSAAEVIPGERSVVHHSIVFVRPPDGADFRGVGWLAAYVPGQKNMKFDPTIARKIPAGSKFVFQQHYTPNGSQKTDITKIGLVFADPDEVKEELLTLIAINQQFEIEPNDDHHTVNADLNWFPRNGKLLSISPHMHYRGKSFSATIKTNSGNKVLLNVPQYDFNWQHIYQFSEPIPLAGTKSLSVKIDFDNSKDNPFNPDPEQFVTWGDQTWEEMAVGFFNVTAPLVDSDDSADEQAESKVTEKLNANPGETSEIQIKVDKFVDEFFGRFDANNDDLITPSEVPLSIRDWGYRRLDSDGETGLSRAEIAEQAKRRFKNRERDHE